MAQTVRANWWLAAGVFGAAVSAACSAPQVEPAPPPSAEFAGVAYPGPTRPPAGASQPAPSQQLDLPLPSGLPRAEAVDKQAFAAGLQNAAVRDEAQLRLARDYHRIVELLLRATPGKGGSAEAYDSVPVYRLHDELVDEWRVLSLRAAALDQRWARLAESLGIALAGGFEDKDRASRLRLQQRFAQCVDADALARLDHAATWNRLRSAGQDAAQIAADPPPAIQFARDVQMMARAMQCGRLALQVIRSM